MSNDDLKITLEMTPNPDSLKYGVNRPVLADGIEYFTSREAAEPWSPLAVALFDLGEVAAVLMGPDFVGIRVASKDNLRELNQRVMAVLREHLSADGPVCKPRPAEATPEEAAQVRKIEEVLEQEIRPAVARDGGNVAFRGYRDGVVFLELQGACRGCPGAAMTLKTGVEARLKDVVPEVKEVLAVN